MHPISASSELGDFWQILELSLSLVFSPTKWEKNNTYLPGLKGFNEVMYILQCLEYTRFQLVGADVTIMAVVVLVGTMVQLSWGLSGCGAVPPLSREHGLCGI